MTQCAGQGATGFGASPYIHVRKPGGLLITVTKLEDNRAKLKHANNVKAEIPKLLKELPRRETLLEENIARARKNQPR